MILLVDKSKNVLIVKKNSTITKNIRFSGKVIAGINCCFLGGIECDELYLSKGCEVCGEIRCERVVVGAYTRFNTIKAVDVLVLRGCIGNAILADGDVRIMGECVIKEVSAGSNLLIEGNSKIGKMQARRILAYET